MNFAQIFNDKIIVPLTSPVSTGASFTSAQDLAVQLARSTGVEPAALGVNYNSGSKELTYHVAFSHTFDSQTKTLTLAAQGLDMDLSATGSLGATVSFAFDL